MGRELNTTDKLYLKYLKNNSDEDEELKLLVKSVNSWLYGVVCYSVADNDLAKDLLKQVWSKFVTKKGNFDLDKYSIEYHIYLIAVGIIYEIIKEDNKQKKSNSYFGRQAVS